ncbi:MAG: AAA family ATPase [Candidatus Dormibacteria bacterium]
MAADANVIELVHIDVVGLDERGHLILEVTFPGGDVVSATVDAADPGTWADVLAETSRRGLGAAAMAHRLHDELRAPAALNGRRAPAASADANDARSLPWQTAAELTAKVPEAIEWLWREYLAFGTVAELDAKLKTGKTTFVGLLLHSILEGVPFLGRKVSSCPVVYLTEEGARTFRSLLVRTRLGGRHDLHVLSKRQVPGLAWQQLVDAARERVRETGARLVVVDTLGKLAGFTDDAENVSGPAMQAMTPLQALASQLNIAVLVLRHDRKSGGEVGESARGSSAIGGDVDVILQLTRVGGDGHERQRCLRTLSRFDETPAELTIELSDGVYREAMPAQAAASLALLAVLPDNEADAVAVVELLPELKDAGHKHTNVYAAVEQLATAGRVGKTTGKGPKGHARTLIWKTFVQPGDVALDEAFSNSNGRPAAEAPGRTASTAPDSSSSARPLRGAWTDAVARPSRADSGGDEPLPDEPLDEPFDEPPGPEDDPRPVEWLEAVAP